MTDEELKELFDKRAAQNAYCLNLMLDPNNNMDPTLVGFLGSQDDFVPINEIDEVSGIVLTSEVDNSLPPQADYTPVPIQTGSSALNAAMQFVGIVEISQNRHPRLDPMFAWSKLAPGGKYCTAGVSYSFYLATRQPKGMGFPYTNSATNCIDFFIRKGWASKDPNAMKNWRGALMGYKKTSNSGHTAFVSNLFLDKHGNVEALEVLGFNTTVPGVKGKTGVTRKRLKLDAKYIYLDTSRIAGGQWWDR